MRVVCGHTKQVAPRAGAWIETSHVLAGVQRKSVAPRAGAWIETDAFAYGCQVMQVAPRGGAWIETPQNLVDLVTDMGRPSCRGVD